MLAEAAAACFYAGKPAEMLAVAERAQGRCPTTRPVRRPVHGGTALGMARIIGGDAAAGAEAIRESDRCSRGSPELRDDLALLPWLALGPIFLRRPTWVGRCSSARSSAARARAALGELPLVLYLIARDQATTDRWAVAEATYPKRSSSPVRAISAPSSLSGSPVSPGSGPAAAGCRSAARPRRSARGLPPARAQHPEVWAIAALGELELGLGNAAGRRAPRSAAAADARARRSPTPTCRPRRSWSTPTSGSGATNEAGAGRGRVT